MNNVFFITPPTIIKWVCMTPGYFTVLTNLTVITLFVAHRVTLMIDLLLLLIIHLLWVLDWETQPSRSAQSIWTTFQTHSWTPSIWCKEAVKGVNNMRAQREWHSKVPFSSFREEQAMETEEDICPPNCPDATDLVCGLIRELSSLKSVNHPTFLLIQHFHLFFSSLSLTSAGAQPLPPLSTPELNFWLVLPLVSFLPHHTHLGFHWLEDGISYRLFGPFSLGHLGLLWPNLDLAPENLWVLR